MNRSELDDKFSQVVQMIPAVAGWQAIYYCEAVPLSQVRYDVIAWILDGIGNITPAITDGAGLVEFGLDTFCKDSNFICLKSPSQSERWVQDQVDEWNARRETK